MDHKQCMVGNYVFAENDKMIKQRNKVVRLKTVTQQFIQQCDPIPLTEEWLIKFGFIKVWNNYRLKPLGYLIDNRLITVGSNYLRHIKYVHQLQNLYFALTGEELQLKE